MKFEIYHKKQTNHLSKFFVVIGFVFVFFSLSSEAFAARLFFETEVIEVGVGQEMEIVLYLDSQAETVNALEGTIHTPGLLSVETIRDGNTLVAFWSERPYVQSDQTIIFSGVIPGGWRGGNGRIFSFIVRTRNQGSGTLTISDAQVLLHDGRGTETLVNMESLTLRVDEATALTPMVFEYDDNELPELFTPMLVQDSDIFEGDYFLVFTAQDKGSGIDHYEVQETKKRLKNEQGGNWQITKSPYLIIDQTLESFVYVRAIDRAGNIRVVVLEPVEVPARGVLITFYIIFIMLLIFIGVFIYRWRRK